MFKSQLSGKQYGPGIKPERVVTKTRQRTYHNEYRNREGIKQYVTSQGWEIVSEMVVGLDEVGDVTQFYPPKG